jgi:hypothetical protein
MRNEKPELTVEQLIDHLKTLDPKMPVGKVGHYGEFYAMNLNDFWIRDAGFGMLPFQCLDIETPFIGDEPE